MILFNILNTPSHSFWENSCWKFTDCLGTVQCKWQSDFVLWFLIFFSLCLKFDNLNMILSGPILLDVPWTLWLWLSISLCDDCYSSSTWRNCRGDKPLVMLFRDYWVRWAEIGGPTIPMESTIPCTRALDWTWRRKWAQYQHSPLSASWCGNTISAAFC